LGRAAFTSEPYRPTEPIRLTGDGPGVWVTGYDPAAQVKVSLPDEGPGGRPCMKAEFAFPGRRHMYVIPALPVPESDLDGYRALRFTYKAKLPRGIAGLLVCLWERGSAQYYADPAPPASDEWKTVTISFEDLKLGAWSKDRNGRLDLDQIASIVIGVHGTAAEDAASGVIWATDVEFVP
jgi:hypothetical protein